jgi:hypothetical protein
MKGLFIAVLLFASFGHAQQRSKPTTGARIGFHGITTGQLTSTLPFQCNHLTGALEYCKEIIDNTLVMITGVEKSRVKYFGVIYGGSFLRTYLMEIKPYECYDEIAIPPISLAQAIRRHSLQKGVRTPPANAA